MMIHLFVQKSVTTPSIRFTRAEIVYTANPLQTNIKFKADHYSIKQNPNNFIVFTATASRATAVQGIRDR